jgi:hypothetical protein
MVSPFRNYHDILTLLAQAESRTLSFSSLLQATALSRRELLSSHEQSTHLSHTSDFWNDFQSYMLYEDERKRYNHNQ